MNTLINYMQHPQSLTFIGMPNRFPDDSAIGSSCFLNDYYYIYNGNKWIKVDGCCTDTHNNRKKKYRNCPNCGAPSGTENRCEYCGSLIVID